MNKLQFNSLHHPSTKMWLGSECKEAKEQRQQQPYLHGIIQNFRTAGDVPLSNLTLQQGPWSYQHIYVHLLLSFFFAKEHIYGHLLPSQELKVLNASRLANRQQCPRQSAAGGDRRRSCSREIISLHLD